MRPPRILIRRLLLFRSSKSPTITRPFTKHTDLPQRRPQVPFLSVPLAGNHQFRYLTTQRKRWLAYEVYLGLKYVVYIWAILSIGSVGFFFVQIEWLERYYPSPQEWLYLTRERFRRAMNEPNRTDVPEPDWTATTNSGMQCLHRLEHPDYDGADLQVLIEDEKYPESPVFDISAKSEPWRRGYYELLMLIAKGAEYLDDQVRDKTRFMVFPANQVIGPSNPHPKPIYHNSPPAPREENVERAFKVPDWFYNKILATKGFTPKQKMDAALQYAAWLDYKGPPDAAGLMYEQALALATEISTPAPAPPPYDTQSYILQDATRAPSANLLTTLTALATYKARSGDVAAALPILLSVLRARRSLAYLEPGSAATPEKPFATFSPSSSSSPSMWTFSNMLRMGKSLLTPPKYPPPPPDGSAPPVRDAAELCEEAGLDMYIGEIIYASGNGGADDKSSSREDGLAWTREAVDLAEEQLHRLNDSNSGGDAAKKTCRECLVAGLENWRVMVAQLAREEREREERELSGSGSSSWLAGLWGEVKTEGTGARWAAEENVVRDRTKRAEEMIEEAEQPPPAGFMSLFKA
ncbi:hypothetical protein GGR54DRAFT_641238 [Hypoxylon sp. NC1633]|nr:hypothetical protein GGR54DRAFT_641238 [Hypoxylon sp. NC1633]